MKEILLQTVMTISVLCGLSVNAANPVVTNVWVGTGASADWFDKTNWENNQLPAYSNVVNLSGLADGSEILLTNWVSCSGIVCNGASSRTLYSTNTILFTFSGLQSGEGTVEVNDGTLSFSSGMLIYLDNTTTLRKKGTGTFCWGKTDPDKIHNLIIEDGCVEPTDETAFRFLNVRVTGNGRLGGSSALSRLFINSYTADNGAELDLAGQKFYFSNPDPIALSASISGTGTVVATAGMLTITNTPSPNITYAAREGSVSFGPSMTPIGFWNFEDVSNPGRDATTSGNDLFASNGVVVVDDPDHMRGKVAYFPPDTNCALYGTNTNGSIKGLPSGNASFTVAAWVRCTQSTDGKSAFFFWGPLPAEATKIFINRRDVNKLFAGFEGDGLYRDITVGQESWWHYAVTYNTSGKLTIYINGGEIGSIFTRTPNLVAANFSIGRPWSTAAKSFSGYLDDVVIVPYALNEQEIQSLLYPETKVISPIIQLNGSENLKIGYNGILYLPPETQTVSIVSGDAVRGGIEMPAGGCLVMTGTTNNETSVYKVGLTGPCDFVKDGTNTTLVLTGRLKHTGTTTVKAGQLLLKNTIYDNYKPFAAYDFEDESNLGADVSGRGRNLTNTNGVQRVWDNERNSYVARFSATAKQDLSGTFTDNDDFAGNSDYTISVWAKPTSACSDNGSFLSFGENNLNNFSQIQFRFGNLKAGKLIWAHWGGTLDFTGIPSTSGTPAGTWHHYVAVHKGTKFYCYCDGVLKFQKESSQQLSFPPLKSIYIGSFFGMDKSPSRYFDGDMDDMRIYSRGLSASDVAGLFAGIEPQIPSSGADGADLPVPILHYAFEDASNPGRDSSTNHFDLSRGGTGTLTIKDSILAGHALAFDESNLSYLFSSNKVLSSVIPGENQPFTVSFWFRASKNEMNIAAATFPTFLCWGATNASVGKIDFMSSFRYDTPWRLRTYLRKNNYGEANDLDSKNEIFGLLAGNDSAWHHLATVYSREKGILNYIDGQFVKKYSQMNSVYSSGPSANSTLYLGLKTTSLTQPFRGMLDEVKIYNVALSQKQLLRAIFLEQSSNLELLPDNTDLSVADGAELVLDTGPQKVRNLSGAGKMTVNGRLTVTGVSSFDGVLSGCGRGTLVLHDGAELTLTQGISSFTGRVELAGGTLALPTDAAPGRAVFAAARIGSRMTLPGEVQILDGAVFSLGDASAVPYLKTPGSVTILGGGSVTLEKPKSFGRWILAEGASLTDQGTDTLASRWSVENLPASIKANFKIVDGRFILEINPAGLIIILR